MRSKLLVANRSEIACRIFQACREMGITAVGIVAPGDEQARHLTYADEIYPVDGYLNVASILQAVQASGSTLVHPGYGFLSERSHFAHAVEEAGFLFVGPTAQTMDLLGGKISSKELAIAHHIPVLPWARVTLGQDLLSAAQAVGFPLLIKASAGGGGKGMRVVSQEADLTAAAESAAAEALSAFGDGTLFLERLLDQPRHIEVQVFGDGLGAGVHLFERDCSVQRRHQKIWEEAPAIQLDETVRQGLFQAALRLVRATSYRSAGTVEFLVDAEGGYYFLEMNTRLQVEHPVTECITGVDLVHAQIALALGQESLREIPSVRGHAIEVRIYAEDPAQGFVPSPGQVEKLKWPTGAGIRVESGIEEGQDVGAQFDSMLAKLVVHAETRAQALARMQFALSETIILGLGTNQSYLSAIAHHPAVQRGAMDIGFLSREMSDFAPTPSSEELQLWAALRAGRLDGRTASVMEGDLENARSPWIDFCKGGVVL